jgi:hypothetical protein
MIVKRVTKCSIDLPSAPQIFKPVIFSGFSFSNYVLSLHKGFQIKKSVHFLKSFAQKTALLEGIKHYTQKIEQADDDLKLPKLSDKDLSIGSFRYFRRSVLYELNSLVEQFLLFYSTDFSEEIASFQKSNLKRSRAQSAKIISEITGLDLSLLQGFHEVEELKEIVNGLKHRGGFDFTDFSKSVPVFRMVKDDIDNLMRIQQGVEQYLIQLTQKLTNENDTN